jgi:hypothetical protein
MRPVLENHLPLPPYSCFTAELACILFLVFSLFALVATLSLCLCSESPYLSIKLYHIYVCYTNITLYIVFDTIRGRPWNVLPVDTGALLHLQNYNPIIYKPLIKVTVFLCTTPRHCRHTAPPNLHLYTTCRCKLRFVPSHFIHSTH